MLWDLLYFYSSSFKASFINNFKDMPLNIIQLNQHSMCRPKGKSTMRGAQPKFEQMITLYILLWPIPFFPNVLAQRSSLCVDQFFVFLGRIPQPSHGLFIHSCFYSKKKERKKNHLQIISFIIFFLETFSILRLLVFLYIQKVDLFIHINALILKCDKSIHSIIDIKRGHFQQSNWLV